MKTVAYLRVSTRSQDLANQKLAILDYAKKGQITVDRFIELQISSLRTLGVPLRANHLDITHYRHHDESYANHADN